MLAASRKLFVLLILLHVSTSAWADAYDLLPYLVQSVCLDAAGAPILGLLPFEASCIRRAPARRDALLPYRRHDWPARRDGLTNPLGYQAQDAVLGTLLGQTAVIQSFDFGADAEKRRFGVFDRGRGDGGQVVVLDGADAFIVMTEDARGGVQWFRSPECKHGGRGWRGWLLIGGVVSERWTSLVARLRIGGTPESCPSAFDASLTRWRRATIQLPWRESATGRVAQITTAVLVSEHFGGASVAAADHLERFYLARDLGMVRWERWENLLLSRQSPHALAVSATASDDRCPALSFSVAPADGWIRVDCRMWTNMVRASSTMPLTALDWPERRLH